MPAAQWGGRSWQAATPPATAAPVFSRLADRARDSTTGLDELLDVMMDPAERDDLEHGLAVGALPGDLNNLASELVVASSGRPLQAVASLCVVCVQSWSVVRGHLVRSGIAHPLRDLPSLWALCDVAENLILESKTDEAERDAYLRRMYPPTQAASARGWTDADEAASWAAFSAAL